VQDSKAKADAVNFPKATSYAAENDERSRQQSFSEQDMETAAWRQVLAVILSPIHVLITVNVCECAPRVLFLAQHLYMNAHDGTHRFQNWEDGVRKEELRL